MVKLCSNKKRERGASLIGTLGISIVAIAVGAVTVNEIRRASNLRTANDVNKMLEKRHAAALEKVTTLVATGALFFDNVPSANVVRSSREHTACNVRAACPADWEDVLTPTPTDVWVDNYVYVPSVCTTAASTWTPYIGFGTPCGGYGAFYGQAFPHVNAAGANVSFVPGVAQVAQLLFPFWWGCWKETPGPTSCTAAYYVNVPYLTTVINNVLVARKKPPAPPAEIRCDSSGNIPSGKGWCLLPHDRVGGDGKTHIKTIVCEANGAEPNGICNAGQTATVVTVKFNSYKAKTSTGFVALPASLSGAFDVEYFGNTEASSKYIVSGGTKDAKTTASISLGDALGIKKLDKNVNDSDFCYFMRPVTSGASAGALLYRTDGMVGKTVVDVNGVTTIGAMDITSLLPRIEGRDAGEFSKEWTIPAPTTGGAATYTVARTLRDNILLNAENHGYRGASATLTVSAKDARVFLGVEPHSTDANAPQFQYYLADNNAAGTFNVANGPFEHAYRCTDPVIAASLGLPACNATYEPQKVVKQTGGVSPYSAACSNTTGAVADFCTRVDMPYGTYAANFSKKCQAAAKYGSQHYLTLAGMSAANQTTYKNLLGNLAYYIKMRDAAIAAGTSPAAANASISSTNALIASFVTSHIAEFQGTSVSPAAEAVPAELLTSIDLPANEMIGCNADWPARVRDIVNYIEHLPNGSGGFHEVYISEVNALLDLDETVLIATLFNRVGSAALDKYNLTKKQVVSTFGNLYSGTSEATEKYSSFSLSSDGQYVKVLGKSLYYGFQYWTKPILTTNVDLDTHTVKRCVYFRYHNIDSPSTCSISMIAPEESGLACRTSDGCFAEDTLIRMADGSERVIQALRKGDAVWNPVSGKSSIIEKVTVGPEKIPMLRVEIAGKVVDVTVGHPFMTANGWKKADELRAGDLVVSSGAALFESVGSVVSLPVGAEPPTVWNISLVGNSESDHYVLANGLVTGDLFIQNQLEKNK